MSRIRRRWLAAWGGALLIAIANGGIREATYAKRLRYHRAGQISGLTGVGAFTLYFLALQRRWPLETRRDALAVGAAWTAMTVVFEFSFGGLVQKESWEEMLAAYNLAEGELWPLVLAWVGIGPEVARRLCPPRISSSPS